ncbi:MAG: hypothetical protein AAGC93_19980 [Cyanobacteria bacterium P01_F01_bin.53]
MKNQKGTGWRAELENLYIGWVHNPLVNWWNGFVDFHSARVDARQRRTIHLAEDDEGMTAELDGTTYKIRELWFEEDFGQVLKQAKQSQKKAAEKQNRKNRPSKRR